MPAKLDVQRTKQLLEAFDFPRLFVEELGWNNPDGRQPIRVQAGEDAYEARPVAELGGVAVLEIACRDIPDAKTRKQIHQRIRPQRAEHILVFVDPGRTKTCWSWVKVEDKREHLRDHYYFRGQPGDAFIAKIAALAVDFSELDQDGRLGLLDASRKVRDALDTQRLIRRFYGEFQSAKDGFVLAIEGIDDPKDRGWYASVLLNRLMFIYFLQKGGFLAGGDPNYLERKLEAHGEDFYPVFLRALFFEAFAKENPSEEARRLCGEIPYLNGGLFIPHRLEEKYRDTVRIPASAFAAVLKLLGAYTWTFNDVPGDPNEEINPDVLGYIFEKYINQKEFGAYYTRPEITDYLCQQTIERLVLDKMAQKSRKRFDSAGDMLLRIDADETYYLLHDVLPSISLLDPACGSGAFLFAALKSMLALYAAAMGRIDSFDDPRLNAWREREFAEHRSVHYWLKKKIITDNLYGVDIMEEATEIAKLRLFMALVGSARPGDTLEPLPNIDFNILPGNSLVGLMRVEDEAFDKNRDKTSSLFGGALRYGELVQKKAALTARYRHPDRNEDIAALRREIDELDRSALPTLDEMLLGEFVRQKVKFEQAAWDAEKAKEGKPVKRDVTLADVQALMPFHWGYQFHERFGPGAGFDAIITNPPWETLKPQDKEFFEKVSTAVTKNKMTIKEFEKHKAELLRGYPELRAEYEAYLSRFPHQSAYFRSAPEYDDQSAIVNGKKTGTDINLYKLFTERCFDLLRPGGLCGIVIPSGVYTDLGAKGLRAMLFERAEITGLFGFENRREIFEGVHRSFKFVVLSYRKGGTTQEFPATFMRHEVSDLQDFPRSLGLPIRVELVKRLSPDSWSLMEFKSDLDVRIAEKMLKFPLLGERIEGTWNLKLTREFDMTNDSHLFHTEPAPGRLPLYEGKMIWQFDSGYLAPRYWVDERTGRTALLGRTRDMGQRLDYQAYRVGFRDIASNTNERTLVSSVIPPAFHGNKIPTADVFSSEGSRLLASDVQLYLCAVWNSFVLDSAIRQKVTTTLNFHYIYALPVPRLDGSSDEQTGDIFAPIVARAAPLICTSPEFADLWNEVFGGGEGTPGAGSRESESGRHDGSPDPRPPSPERPAPLDPPDGLPRTWTPACGATDPATRARLRAELDGLVAHLYELTEEEFTHILATFPLVADEVKRAALEEYRRLARGQESST